MYPMPNVTPHMTSDKPPMAKVITEMPKVACPLAENIYPPGRIERLFGEA